MINGIFLDYINAIGSREGEADILTPIQIIGENFILECFNAGGVNNTFYKFVNSGIEFVFDNGILISIMFYLMPIEGYKAYVGLPRLITGFPENSTRADVLNILGKPLAVGKGDFGWLKYSVNNKTIHFEFDENGAAKRVTLLKN